MGFMYSSSSPSSDRAPPRRLLTAVLAGCALAACTAPPLVPFSTDGPPPVMMPASEAGVTDGRGSFGYVVYVGPNDFEKAAAALGI